MKSILIKQLDARGIVHYIVPVVVVVGLAVAGTAAIVASHADSLSPTDKNTGRIQISAVLPGGGCTIKPLHEGPDFPTSGPAKQFWLCANVQTRRDTTSPIFLRTLTQNSYCFNQRLHKYVNLSKAKSEFFGDEHNFGVFRTIKCSPGYYVAYSNTSVIPTVYRPSLSQDVKLLSGDRLYDVQSDSLRVRKGKTVRAAFSIATTKQ